MTELKSVSEYNALFNKNKLLELCEGNTFVHLPCPFCAAPNWLVYNIMESDAALKKGAVCLTCKRGARGTIGRTYKGVRRLTMYKISGPRQPMWMDPQMPQLK